MSSFRRIQQTSSTHGQKYVYVKEIFNVVPIMGFIPIWGFFQAGKAFGGDYLGRYIKDYRHVGFFGGVTWYYCYRNSSNQLRYVSQRYGILKQGAIPE